ncbi:hypothetical protein ACFZB4_42375 [Streptomyces pseudovenezuelae]|uniref:hypothetical protein n=1 Tax=Streptomyces pseudovenezuelae TaxID=67350 RepID=UPI0036E83178
MGDSEGEEVSEERPADTPRRRAGRPAKPLNEHEHSPQMYAWLMHLRGLVAVFGTQETAARLLHLDPGELSKRLNGRLPGPKFVDQLLGALQTADNEVSVELRARTWLLYKEALGHNSPFRRTLELTDQVTALQTDNLKLHARLEDLQQQLGRTIEVAANRAADFDRLSEQERTAARLAQEHAVRLESELNQARYDLLLGEEKIRSLRRQLDLARTELEQLAREQQPNQDQDLALAGAIAGARTAASGRSTMALSPIVFLTPAAIAQLARHATPEEATMLYVAAARELPDAELQALADQIPASDGRILWRAAGRERPARELVGLMRKRLRATRRRSRGLFGGDPTALIGLDRYSQRAALGAFLSHTVVREWTAVRTAEFGEMITGVGSDRAACAVGDLVVSLRGSGDLTLRLVARQIMMRAASRSVSDIPDLVRGLQRHGLTSDIYEVIRRSTLISSCSDLAILLVALHDAGLEQECHQAVREISSRRSARADITTLAIQLRAQGRIDLLLDGPLAPKLRRIIDSQP